MRSRAFGPPPVHGGSVTSPLPGSPARGHLGAGATPSFAHEGAQRVAGLFASSGDWFMHDGGDAKAHKPKLAASDLIKRDDLGGFRLRGPLRARQGVILPLWVPGAVRGPRSRCTGVVGPWRVDCRKEVPERLGQRIEPRLGLDSQNHGLLA